jgi:hypothetical protein
MASYALEGLVEGVLAEDGRWLRENVEMVIIPFVDKDGVEEGDQGKNRRPHDHNRDYEGEGIYASVRALRRTVSGWPAGELAAALDLHCPWIRGEHNQCIYIVGSRHEEISRRQREFGRILEAVQTGPLVYSTADDLPFGEGWNRPRDAGAGVSFGEWASEIPGVGLVASMEIPYADARGVEVTARSARAFGRDLARALDDYLRTSHRNLPGGGPPSA